MLLQQQEAPHLNDSRTTIFEALAAGALFVLLLQCRPFRWAAYAIFAWGVFRWVQDSRSEHRLPDDTPALAWMIENADRQPPYSTRSLTYNVAFRVENRGDATLQSATLLGTLYECPNGDDAVDACTAIDRSRRYVALDLPPGFAHHMAVNPSFSHAGGPNPRVTWAIIETIADRDSR